MNFPKVSIILLTHNRSEYLSEAIESVKNQTMKNWEIIIIDDFSTKQTEVILKNTIKDERIRAFKTNYDVDNISVLWNRALDFATGEYIAMLDDDNRKCPAFCQEMSEYLDNHLSLDAVVCHNYEMGEDGKVDKVIKLSDELSKESILKRNCVDSGNLMFRRSVLSKVGWFDERIKTEEDWDFIIRLLYNSGGIGKIQKPLAEYRRHSENRYHRSKLLGLTKNRDLIRSKISQHGRKMAVLLTHPEPFKPASSQKGVLAGIDAALKQMDWVDHKMVVESKIKLEQKTYDVVLVFMPFITNMDNIKEARKKGNLLVTYQCEDPFAFEENKRKVVVADYIFTNEISLIEEYEKIVGRGCAGFCPSVSVNSVDLVFREDAEKVNDVIFYGYAYDSRIAFVRSLVPLLNKFGLNLTVVGGGAWENLNISGVRCMKELTEQESISLMEESKIVVLHNRKETDVSRNSHLKADSVVRGYFECASGSLVMLDKDRSHHNFNDEVVFYSSTNDLVEKIKFYLKEDKLRQEIGKKAKERALTDFTYRKRVTDLINGIRSMRYYHEIR